MGGCGEMSGGVEIVLYFHVVCASPPFLLCAGMAPREKTKSTRKCAGVSWWSCPRPRTTKRTRKIASKTPLEVDKRENTPLINRS